MKLKDYYNEIVELNDSKTGGWSQYYYGIVSKIINDNNFKNCCRNWYWLWYTC
jgi:hypothetical protein